MYIELKALRTNRWMAIALGAALLSLPTARAQSPEETTLISTNLSDHELVEFSKVEPRFSATAFSLVQSRICAYADAAATSHGQMTPSELRLHRTTVPPRSLALTNAILAARLFVDYTTPPEVSQGEQAVTWNELGFLVLERANAVLHHYYLAVEYRNGHEAALPCLRQATRDLSAYLSKRADGALAERLQMVRARYAALWFDRCEEVLPIYQELIGSGARGEIRDALVLRPELPLVTGWDWDQRKRADVIHKDFVQNLCASSNSAVRIDGLLLGAARARTDRSFSTVFTNLLASIDTAAQKESTRTAYSNLVKELLDDRHSRTLLDKTRNELRRFYEARFMVETEGTTNSEPATVVVATNAPTVINAVPAARKPVVKPVVHATAAKSTAAAPRPKAPLSWQVLLTPADISYWEKMPLIETRSLAKSGDVVANYYLFLKLRNSEAPNELAEAEAGLQRAFKAELPQAQLSYANRNTDAEDRFLWTKKAASTGFPAAQLALGELYILGHGIQMDLERGLGLVRAAYDLKVPEAEVILAELYASGIGSSRNATEKPAALFLSAARNNQPKAMLELHERFLAGFLVVRDQLEASRWLVNAGLHNKEFLARYLDEEGKSRPQPNADLDRFAKTLAVYGQAVIHKQAEAIKHVAEWYEHGSVGRKSSIRAYALTTLVNDKEKISPEMVKRLRASLTPQELKTAETLVSQWQKVSPDLM